MSELCRSGRRGGLMVSALDSGASGLGSSPGRGHCVVFLGKTLYSHGASLHPGVYRGYYMPARGYEFYLRVVNSISHE